MEGLVEQVIDRYGSRLTLERGASVQELERESLRQALLWALI